MRSESLTKYVGYFKIIELFDPLRRFFYESEIIG